MTENLPLGTPTPSDNVTNTRGSGVIVDIRTEKKKKKVKVGGILSIYIYIRKGWVPPIGSLTTVSPEKT